MSALNRNPVWLYDTGPTNGRECTRMRMHRFLVFGLIWAASAAAGTSAHASSEAAAIKRARLQQNAAIARHDLQAIAAYWTDEVTICRGLGVQLAGKANYLALFAEDDPKSKDLIIYERIPMDVEASSLWPLAFETGIWKGHAGGADGAVVIRGRYSAQWVRRDDRWLIRSEVFVALGGSGPGLQMKAAP